MSEKLFWQRIQGKLIILLLVPLVPLLVIQGYIYHERFESRRYEELQANLELARAVAKSFETFVQDILQQELSIGLALTSSQALSLEDQNRILTWSKVEQPSIWNFCWVNLDGTVVSASQPGTIGANLKDYQCFQELLAGRVWMVGDLVQQIGPTVKVSFTISRAIRDEGGKLLGVIVAVALPDQLDGIVGIERSKGGAICLLDRNGMLVYRYPHLHSGWAERHWLNSSPQLRKALAGEEVTWIGKPGYEDKVRIMASVPIVSIGWAAGAGRTEEDAIAAIKASLLPQTVLLLLVTLAAFGNALLLSRPVSASIKRLRNHALALGRGETGTLALKSGISEIRELAEALNTMSEKVRLREAALRDSRERLQRIVEVSPFPAIIHAEDGDVIMVNPAWTRICGYCREDIPTVDAWTRVCGCAPGEILSVDTWAEWTNGQRKLPVKAHVDVLYKLNRMVPEGEYLINTAMGQQRTWDFYSGPMGLDSQGRRLIISTAADVTERKQMEEKLRRAHDELEIRVHQRTAELEKVNEQLRLVPQRMIAVQEEERKRLAGELHDSVGQTLAALKFRMEQVLVTMKNGDSGQSLQLVEQFIPVIQYSIEETRSIYMGLRPRMLEELGVVPTLRWYCRELLNLYPNRHIELDISFEEDDIPEHLKVAIFRITQEALNNVAKHSRAEWVDVSLKRNDEAIYLVISDDGRGMDTEYILRTATARSLGLTGMKERAELTGGHLSIESTPGEGTTVKAVWQMACPFVCGGDNG
ncbi:MAG: cache domain-containing protein [Syntrophobacteraceae bacterium]